MAVFNDIRIITAPPFLNTRFC